MRSTRPACLESAINIELQAAANAPSPPPPPTTINILTVPSGTFVNDAMMQRINESADSFDRRALLDYAAEPTQVAIATSSPEPPLDNTPNLSPSEQLPPVDAQDGAPELDPLRRRALELGFTLLPRRPARVD
jgi:hypothetical protein